MNRVCQLFKSTCHVSDIAFFSVLVLSHLTLLATLRDGFCRYFHFIGKQTEAQRKQVIIILAVCPHMSIVKNRMDDDGAVRSL